MPLPVLLSAFVAAAAVLWLSIFGYLALLALVTAVRQRSAPAAEVPEADLPRVAVVVPVRNEEDLVARKLADVARTDYPARLLRTVVVDGGSTDATTALVETARERGAAVELVRVPGATGRAAQLNAVLPRLDEDFVVVTDADAELDPSCVRRLVALLVADPETDVAGARVRPATRLLEERVHWWILGSLWWLEGEALGNSQVSGVCYALRRTAATPLPDDCSADDIRFGLVASARGRRVRLCRTAHATELRVPQTLREIVRFRRRRGTGYLRELRRTRPEGAPRLWRMVQALRLYHFFVMPVLSAAVTVAALVLFAAGEWAWTLAAAAAFVVPLGTAMLASTTLGDGRPWWRLGVAAGRLAALTWLAMVALPRRTGADAARRLR